MFILELGIICGTIGFSYYHTYVGLIGISHGIYSVIGASLANVIINYDILPDELLFQISITLVTQFIAEIISYVFFYQEHVAYTAHIFGFLFGLVCGVYLVNNRLLSFKKNDWKSYLSLFSLSILLFSLAYFIYDYSNSWPYGISPDSSCCLSMFQLNNDYGYSFDFIKKNFYCPNQFAQLVEKMQD